MFFSEMVFSVLFVALLQNMTVPRETVYFDFPRISMFSMFEILGKTKLFHSGPVIK